jgi:hypothetical protein
MRSAQICHVLQYSRAQASIIFHISYINMKPEAVAQVKVSGLGEVASIALFSAFASSRLRCSTAASRINALPLADCESAVRFHVETFGPEVLDAEGSILRTICTQSGIAREDFLRAYDRA